MDGFARSRRTVDLLNALMRRSLLRTLHKMLWFSTLMHSFDKGGLFLKPPEHSLSGLHLQFCETWSACPLLYQPFIFMFSSCPPTRLLVTVVRCRHRRSHALHRQSLLPSSFHVLEHVVSFEQTPHTGDRHNRRRKDDRQEHCPKLAAKDL